MSAGHARTRRARALLAAALLAASCAHAPEAGLAELAPPPPGRGRLYVYRPKGGAGPHDAGGITLDRRPLASLDKGEFVSVALEPGPHALETGVSEPSRLARLPTKTVQLEADRALFCGLVAQLDGVFVLWELSCSADPNAHPALRACRRGKLDRTVDWQP